MPSIISMRHIPYLKTLYYALLITLITIYGAHSQTPMKGIIQESTKECALSASDYKSGSKRFADTKKRKQKQLLTALQVKGVKLGDPIYFRAFKAEKKLELWMQPQGSNKFKLIHTYPIAKLSGKLGPKTKQGDGQVPEGFYYIKKHQLKADSRFHHAFNIGYPNSYDKAHASTGDFIMVHGSDLSVGCYAMTDDLIEEIYLIAHAALHSGKQNFYRFHSFPFHMSDANLNQMSNHKQYAFWKNLKQGYDHFELKKTPPNVKVIDKKYVFN